jgi:hypothetical protein
MKRTTNTLSVLFFSLLLLPARATAQDIDPELTGLRAIGTPADPKVEVSWNRYFDYATYTQISKDLARAYPNLVTLQTIGQSTEGRDMTVLIITDPSTGSHTQKPGFWIDGGIHANEMQGTQFAMYTAWYLAENYGHIEFITNLLKDKTFYILPSLSPDSRENFIYQSNTANSSRSGMRPFDDDGDGKVNEDLADDLNGDGHITMMRRKSATGRWIPDPNYPARMMQVGPDQMGEYEMLGNEGIDNDEDGRVNEDDHGRYDPNRDWAWSWQPDYVQGGALFYPGSLPETRNVKAFVMAHPNIAGAQSYHNFGGMFLRGAGAREDQGFYTRADDAVYDLIGKQGERMIPGYNYYVIWKDLYTVYGGEIDWFSLARGIFTFSNEINNSYRLFHENRNEGRFQNDEFNEFDKYLLFGDGYVNWEPYDHPQYGPIEIGGSKKNYIRNTPGFMLEEEGHRNMAFTLLHAFHTPKLDILEVEEQALGNGLTQITATLINTRAMPTHSSHDLKYKIERPNLVTLKGEDVIAGMLVDDKDLGLTSEQKTTPETIRVANIPGTVAGGGYGTAGNTVRVRWIIKGSSREYTIELDSRKGGVIEKTLRPS